VPLPLAPVIFFLGSHDGSHAYLFSILSEFVGIVCVCVCVYIFSLSFSYLFCESEDCWGTAPHSNKESQIMAVTSKPTVHSLYHDYVRIARMIRFEASDPATIIRVLQLLPRTLKISFVLILLYPVGLAYVYLTCYTRFPPPPAPLSFSQIAFTHLGFESEVFLSAADKISLLGFSQVDQLFFDFGFLFQFMLSIVKISIFVFYRRFLPRGLYHAALHFCIAATAMLAIAMALVSFPPPLLILCMWSDLGGRKEAKAQLGREEEQESLDTADKKKAHKSVGVRNAC
jgi:hypothetical protein